MFGEGNLDAALMIVGEAPGAKEVAEGRPFVGIAGKLLDREMSQIGIDRADTYITNVVKCRLIKPNTKANRPPSIDDRQIWRPVLLREIEIIFPKCILCLGSTAANELIHRSFKMREQRGVLFSGQFGITTIATYHPAYVQRWQDQSILSDFQYDLTAASRVAMNST